MFQPSSLPEAEVISLLRLHLATLYDFSLGIRLLGAFGDAAALFRTPPERVWSRLGKKPRRATRLFSAEVASAAEAEYQRAVKERVHILCCTAEEYPLPLGSVPERPVALFARGLGPNSPTARRLAGDEWLTLGVVGSRRPTVYGRRQARRLARALASEGVAIVSGLARGVDGEAHRACLDAGGVTIAVLGSGLGRIYPPEHDTLLQQISSGDSGAAVTPFPFLAAPRPFHFPLRNGVLSGLSCLLLVAEAGEKSGTLITVDHALRQGRSVYALPGRVDEDGCRGCLRLLQDGAGLVMEPADLFLALVTHVNVAMSPARRAHLTRLVESKSSNDNCPPTLDGPFGAVLGELFAQQDAWHPDTLADRLGAPAADVLRELSRLELSGQLQRLAGGAYTLVVR